MRKLTNYFSKAEIVLWMTSVIVILVSFCAFDRTNYMTLCASLIGVTSLIFNAKGNPFGQVQVCMTAATFLWWYVLWRFWRMISMAL